MNTWHIAPHYTAAQLTRLHEEARERAHALRAEAMDNFWRDVGEVVVTQPDEGTFKAFSAICPHQGCSVGSVADDVITCPCHGSTFSIADGSVQGGPARGPLTAVPVTVSGT